MCLNEKLNLSKKDLLTFFSPFLWTSTEIGLSLMGSVKSAGRVTVTMMSVAQRQQLKALKFCQ